MKRKLLLALFILITCISISIGYLYTSDIYLPYQLVNGEKGFKSAQESYESFYENIPSTLELVTNGDTVKLNTAFIQRAAYEDFTHNSFLDWVKAEPIEVEPYTINTDLLRDALVLHESECVDASIAESINGFELVPEVYGFNYSNKVLEHIVDSIKSQEYVIDCKDYLQRPAVTTKTLEPVFKRISWINDFSLTYDNGYTIDYKSLKPYIKDFELINLYEFYEYQINTIQSQYDTRETVFKFPTSNNTNVDVDYVTYGKYIDEEKELEFLKSSIENKESVSNHEPALKGYDDIGSTYVEISIDDQHLWYYVDGILEMETDVVTGHMKKHDTPKGVYYITERIDGKYLRGTGYVTWVDKWMRLTNSGIGLHDATWRSSFGGEIYKRDGSHGCINLPKSFAYNLFDNVKVGLPVIIY